MRTADLEYDLPAELIATKPARPRDAARLLVYHRADDRIEHAHVRDLPRFLRPGDCMVLNDTAVLPARFFGRRVETGGRIEGLFLREIDEDDGRVWEVMLKAGGRMAAGTVIELTATVGGGGGVRVRVTGRGEDGTFLVEPQGTERAASVFARIGTTPLPPYILKARQREAVRDPDDRAWYETVYAREGARRSVAAPTAGLHFTPELLAAIDARDVKRVAVTLDVGAGTFKPVDTDHLEDHAMHTERFEAETSVFQSIDQARARGGRSIAVGTTTVRCLESVTRAELSGEERSIIRETDLLIAPPYDFRWIDGLMTNFHLPRSTLLALVGALIGVDCLLAVYAEAVRERYRFYSYGDAMLVL